ncbi:MAG: Tad domain-containing protein [Persicimonas sp.]
MKVSVKKVRSFFYQSPNNEKGAVVLLCLAAVMILALIAWVMVDAQKASQDKVMLQGAADTAAYSHSAVEARSMNMISFANVAKRSIVGIHSMYPGMFFVYTIWLIYQATGCIPVPYPPFVRDPEKCARAIYNAPMWIKEFTKDHTTYSGNPAKPYLMAGERAIQRLVDLINSYTPFNVSTGTSGADGFTKTAYGRDIKALDNYQRYTDDITPWWAWSEQLSRGWRNGASSVASFPPPPGDVNQTMSAVQGLIQKINDILSMVGSSGIDWTVHRGNDNLPVEKTPYQEEDWLCRMVLNLDSCGLSSLSWDTITSGDVPYLAEHVANTLYHRMESERGAKKWINVVGGTTLGFATVGLAYSRAAFGEASHPWGIDSDTTGSEGEWLKHTSNLVFAYQNDPDRMAEDGDRKKYDMLPRDYEHGGLGGIIDEELYAASGYWTVSKSEITFDGEGVSPDVWHPSWTARMRPVNLPGELDDSDLNMNIAYNEALPHLALTAQLASMEGGGTTDAVLSSLRDFAVMEASTAAMGNSTVSGFGK